MSIRAVGLFVAVIVCVCECVRVRVNVCECVRVRVCVCMSAVVALHVRALVRASLLSR